MGGVSGGAAAEANEETRLTEAEITEAEILAKTAEVARHVSTWHDAGRD